MVNGSVWTLRDAMEMSGPEKYMGTVTILETNCYASIGVS